MKRTALPDFLSPKARADEDVSMTSVDASKNQGSSSTSTKAITSAPTAFAANDASSSTSSSVLPTTPAPVSLVPESTTVAERQRNRLARMTQLLNQRPSTSSSLSSSLSSQSQSQPVPIQLVDTSTSEADKSMEEEHNDVEIDEPSQDLDEALQVVLQEEAAREADQKHTVEPVQVPSKEKESRSQTKRVATKRTIPAFLLASEQEPVEEEEAQHQQKRSKLDIPSIVHSRTNLNNELSQQIDFSASIPSSLPQLSPLSPTHVSNIIEAVTHPELVTSQISSSSSVPATSSSSSSTVPNLSWFRYPVPAKIRPSPYEPTESSSDYAKRVLVEYRQKMLKKNSSKSPVKPGPESTTEKKQSSDPSSATPAANAPPTLTRNKSTKLTPAQRQKNAATNYCRG